jgi:hypothetical protein
MGLLYVRSRLRLDVGSYSKQRSFPFSNPLMSPLERGTVGAVVRPHTPYYVLERWGGFDACSVPEYLSKQESSWSGWVDGDIVGDGELVRDYVYK